MLAHPRVVAPVVAMLVALVTASCSEEEPIAAGAAPADLPEDFCAVVVPVVPPDLGLGDPVSSVDDGDGDTTSSSCTLTGPGDARLEADVTSYALVDADDLREVALAKGAACDQLLGRAGSTDEEEDEFACRTVLADGTVSTVDQVIQHRAVLRMELKLAEKLGEQAAAYSSAIRFGIITQTEDTD